MGFLNKIPRIIRWVFSVLFLFFILMSLYRLLFFFHYQPANRPFSGSAFLLGMRYDARMVSILGIVMLLLCLIPFLNPFKRKAAVGFWTIFLSLVFFISLIVYGADFYHYDYLHQRLNASVLNYLQDAGISAGMMWQTYPLLKISVAFIVLLLLFAGWTKRKLKAFQEKQPLEKSKLNTVWYIVFVLILGGYCFGKLNQYPLRWSDAFIFTDEFKSATALNPYQSFFSSLSFKNSGYDIKKVRESYATMADYLDVKDKDSSKLNYERTYSFTDVPQVHPNVIVVICESFSAYKSSMFGNKMDATPYFNSMCNEGVFFERCFTPAFGTARGVWATITGIPDVEQPKTASRNPSAVDQHTIISDFTDHKKFYFLGGSTTWANIRGLLHNNIEDLTIYEQENFKAQKEDVWGISDKNLFLEANKILSQQTKPFFAVIQTADNHRPYTIPAEDLDEFKKVNYPADTLKKYGFDDNGQLNAFRYTDFNYRKFIEAAKKEKYFKNTIFVFVGDHGLHGDAGDLFPQSFTKQGILNEHVPLLFYAPGLLQPKKVRKVASQLDILPSVASICKQPYINNAFGRNLFDSADTKQRYAFIADPDLSTIGVVSDEYYYRRNLKTGSKDFVSVINNDPVNNNAHTDSLQKQMSTLTEAWYETAKYLLYNNKKKKK
ncbi:MAG: sulfatase-like hydrolase/transferase [Bacteroidetes bacterium]|nr:sulfatase-like hydrolase/transferase [Bacteroidota bacterium]